MLSDVPAVPADKLLSGMRPSALEDHNSLAQGEVAGAVSCSSPPDATSRPRKSPLAHLLRRSMSTRLRLRLRLKSIYASSSLSLGQGRVGTARSVRVVFICSIPWVCADGKHRLGVCIEVAFVFVNDPGTKTVLEFDLLADDGH